MKRKREPTSPSSDDELKAKPPTKAKAKAKTKAPPPRAKVKDDPAFLALKHALSISPKTTNLLLTSGYTTYQALADTTPNILIQQFAKHGNMEKKHVEGYRRAFRGMVWLGTQPEPEKIGKQCQMFTIKDLSAMGVWVEDWDDLTGKEVDERFGERLVEEVL